MSDLVFDRYTFIDIRDSLNYRMRGAERLSTLCGTYLLVLRPDFKWQNHRHSIATPSHLGSEHGFECIFRDFRWNLWHICLAVTPVRHNEGLQMLLRFTISVARDVDVFQCVSIFVAMQNMRCQETGGTWYLASTVIMYYSLHDCTDPVDNYQLADSI